MAFRPCRSHNPTFDPDDDDDDADEPLPPIFGFCVFLFDFGSDFGSDFSSDFGSDFCIISSLLNFVLPLLTILFH